MDGETVGTRKQPGHATITALQQKKSSVNGALGLPLHRDSVGKWSGLNWCLKECVSLNRLGDRQAQHANHCQTARPQLQVLVKRRQQLPQCTICLQVL